MIRKRVYPSGKVSWQVDVWLQDGSGSCKRRQKSYETEKAAEKALKKIRETREKQGLEAFSLSTEDRVRYQAAERRLKEAGLTLEEAVDLAILHGRRSKEAVDLGELWKLFKADRERRNRDPVWVGKLGVAINSFILGRELKQAHLVTRPEIDNWITGNGWKPKTQKNYLGALSSMFAWGKVEGYVAVNPCLKIELPTSAEREPVVLSVEACERLLNLALNGEGEAWDYRAQKYRKAFIYRPLLGYIAVAMFGGVRPEEIARSPRSVIDLDHAVLIVAAGRAKPGRGNTRRRRVVDLSANAVAWLKRWNKLCPGGWIVPKGFAPDWRALRIAAECWPWPHDALRHTFATMHYAMHQNETRLKAQMGHSRGEDTLFEHYRAVQLPDGKLVTKAMAEKFWGLSPK